MEFPQLGQHCNETSCQQLDFLPMKCDACLKIYCRDHIVYSTHNCPESYRKDNQIPVCPLCNAPCPVKKGELPDVVVGRHIESDCLSDPAKERRKVYTNKCSKRGCKQKELVPVKCESCRLNFCLRHRHEQDHDCQGFSGTGKAVSNAGAAAISRASQASSKKPHPQAASASSATQYQTGSNINKSNSNSSRPGVRTNLSTVQGSLSEDEALARALQMSLNENSSMTPSHPDTMTEQEREDFLLAQALAASEQEAPGQRVQPARPQRTVDRCALQ